ncbi:hypothetical protein [Hahella sp. HN01]|uniref:hypothetical protein n=1 Tax=Hahella sp. HN01 TaxID=2847262 RepID=UPI001C1EB33D|nr:hypothetical protein [Hahella sp. HN01]MBU6955977.1 hypothetical protein [Hahella sp. HN01]
MVESLYLNTVDIVLSLLHKRVVEIHCFIEELDFGGEDDYDFEFCSFVFLGLETGGYICFESIDVDSNYSLYAEEVSDVEFRKRVKYFENDLPVHIKKYCIKKGGG